MKANCPKCSERWEWEDMARKGRARERCFQTLMGTRITRGPCPGSGRRAAPWRLSGELLQVGGVGWLYHLGVWLAGWSWLLFEGFSNPVVETPGGTRYTRSIDFGSFLQFNKIILHFNLVVQGISNDSQSCIFCGLISAWVIRSSELLIENTERDWTQDGSLPNHIQ